MLTYGLRAIQIQTYSDAFWPRAPYAGEVLRLRDKMEAEVAYAEAQCFQVSPKALKESCTVRLML